MSDGTPGGAPLICVLEDDSFQRTWFERLLERAGFRVRSYGDPRDFLARRAERPLPDVLLLDIVLLDMNAFQVLSELEEDAHWCQVPVVLMTASATKDRVLSAQRLQLRPEGFLAKPVDVRSMLLLIRSICDAQDPTMRLRRLQRLHRSSEIHIRRDLRELDKAVGGNEENARKYSRRRVEALRRAQELRLQEATLRPIGRQKEELTAQIREAEAEAEQCRTQAKIDEAEHRQVLGTEISHHRKRLQELDTEMATLTLRLRMLGTDQPSRPAVAETAAATAAKAAAVPQPASQSGEATSAAEATAPAPETVPLSAPATPAAEPTTAPGDGDSAAHPEGGHGPDSELHAA
jgi:CheY-like chemotaxis protein